MVSLPGTLLRTRGERVGSVGAGGGEPTCHWVGESLLFPADGADGRSSAPLACSAGLHLNGSLSNEVGTRGEVAAAVPPRASRVSTAFLMT